MTFKIPAAGLIAGLLLCPAAPRAQTITLYSSNGFEAFTPGSLVGTPQQGWTGGAYDGADDPAIVTTPGGLVLRLSVPDGVPPLDTRKESRVVRAFSPPLDITPFATFTLEYDIQLDADENELRQNYYFDFDPASNKFLGDAQIIQDNGYVQMARGGNQANGQGVATAGWHHLKWVFHRDTGTLDSWFDATPIDVASAVTLAGLIGDQPGEDPDGNPNTLDALSMALVSDWWSGPGDAVNVDNVVVSGSYAALTALNLQPGYLRVRAGGTGPLRAIGATPGGSVDVSAGAAWSSDNTSVAGVVGGVVTGVSAGTTLVHATFQGFTAQATVSVEGSLPPAPTAYYPRVFVLNSDPLLESQGGQRLHTYAGWGDPRTLTSAYISDLAAASHGWVNQRVTGWVDEDLFPLKEDGFRYDDASYLAGLGGGGWHDPDGAEYAEAVRHHDLARRADSGELDEVLWFGAPYFGYYESRMAGWGGYWCNSPPMSRVASTRVSIIMGLNYERGVAEMLHSAGHRSESILSQAYGGWDITQSRTDWERFTHNIGQSPDAACGSVHYPPNGTSDYDYENPTPVVSTAIDWLLNFPNLAGETSIIGRDSWGGPDYQRNFMDWWYGHMPHLPGVSTHDGLTRLNSWWPYLFDLNRYPESGGEFVVGGPIPVAQPWTQSLAEQLTTNTRDDWAPRAMNGGAVWSGWDGHDYEIYYGYMGGEPVTALTNNDTDDVGPEVNWNNTVVWQGFDGQDWEIYARSIYLPTTVRLTNNAFDDRHPDINDNGRVVWEGFNGTDDEIYSADATGGPVVVLSDATATGVPRPDNVWPRITDNGRVVWAGRTGGQWDIFAADATGGNRVNLSNSPGVDDEYPAVARWGHHVVWHGWHSDSNSEIYAAPVSGAGPVTRLTNDDRLDWYPQVNEWGRVVWMTRVGPGNWDIHAADVDGANPAVLGDSPEPEEYPRISDEGVVAWQGFDGEDWEVYSWDGRPGSPWQMTDNHVDDRWPTLAWRPCNCGAPVDDPPSLLVWHAETGATTPPTSEIWAMTAGPRARLGAVGDPPPHAGPSAPRLDLVSGNPVRGAAAFRLTLPRAAAVRVEVFDIAGRRLVTLRDGLVPAGALALEWNGRDERGRAAASGVYFVRMTSGGSAITRKLTLARD